MKSSISNLKDRGFVSVEYPASLRKAVKETVEAWKEFCALPAEIKQSVGYVNGVGYELKQEEGKTLDKKENFDVILGASQSLNISNDVVEHFVLHAEHLVRLMKELVSDFAQEVEDEFTIDSFHQEVTSAEDRYFVRFIHYFGDRKAGDDIATPHADQSGFTLHLFESAPGLQALSYDGKWIDMNVSDGETVIIPSMQMQLRSGGDIKALCHRVVATPESAEKGRYSAVCFVQLKDTVKYDKENQGRLQDKEPGFNYSMEYDEFQQLFKA